MNTNQHLALVLIAFGLLLGGAAGWMLLIGVGNPRVSVALLVANALMVALNVVVFLHAGAR